MGAIIATVILFTVWYGVQRTIFELMLKSLRKEYLFPVLGAYFEELFARLPGKIGRRKKAEFMNEKAVVDCFYDTMGRGIGFHLGNLFMLVMLFKIWFVWF